MRRNPFIGIADSIREEGTPNRAARCSQNITVQNSYFSLKSIGGYLAYLSSAACIQYLVLTGHKEFTKAFFFSKMDTASSPLQPDPQIPFAANYPDLQMMQLSCEELPT